MWKWLERLDDWWTNEGPNSIRLRYSIERKGDAFRVRVIDWDGQGCHVYGFESYGACRAYIEGAVEEQLQFQREVTARRHAERLAERGWRRVE